MVLLFNKLGSINLPLLFSKLGGIDLFCCLVNLVLLFNKSKGINLVVLLNESIKFCSEGKLHIFIILCFMFLGASRLNVCFNVCVCVCVLMFRFCMFNGWRGWVLFYWKCEWSWWKCTNYLHLNVILINIKCWKCAYTIWQHVKCWCFATYGCRSTTNSLETTQLNVYLLGMFCHLQQLAFGFGKHTML
jgi:hypothetical protein